jgi:hypothetical protein
MTIFLEARKSTSITAYRAGRKSFSSEDNLVKTLKIFGARNWPSI